MEKDESIQNAETTSNFLVQMLTDEKEGPEFVRAYLKSSFLSSAIDALFYARSQSDLTQREVADVMKTKQAAIARMEADTSGTMSLHRYVEFALACGMMPLDIQLVPIKTLQSYVIDNPDAPKTQELYNTWLLANVPKSGNSVKTDITNAATTLNTYETSYDAQRTVDFAENFLKPATQQVQEVKPLGFTADYQNHIQSSSSLGHALSQERVAA